jgi:hypothetical protein
MFPQTPVQDMEGVDDERQNILPLTVHGQRGPWQRNYQLHFEVAMTVVGGTGEFGPSVQDGFVGVILQAGQLLIDFIPPLRKNFQVPGCDVNIQRKHAGLLLSQAFERV